MNNIKKFWKIEVPENANIRAMLSYSPDYYKKRLEKIGFYGQKTKLLDAGCGAGHWSIAASYLNAEVRGLDSTEKYLKVAKEINKQFKRKNLKFTFGKMEALPYPDDYFDYVISYCAWMYTNRGESLREMKRVLKPGGKIYLGAVAGLGWYLKLIWQGVKSGNRHLIWESLRAIKNRILTPEAETRKLFRKENLQLIGLGADATLGDSSVKVRPCYDDKILGFWNVYEVLAEKSKNIERKS